MKNARNAVLIVTNHEDPGHASFVAAALDSIEHPYLRLNCDDFPSGPARLFSTRRNPDDDLDSGRVFVNLDSDRARGYIQRGHQRLALSDIGTVWFRRARRGAVPAALQGDTRAYALEASDEALDAVYLELQDRLWVNEPWRQRRLADNKWHQLRIASEVGLRVPDTLVTTDPHAARAFYRRHHGDVVFKPTRPYLRSDLPTEAVAVWVSKVESAHLENEDVFAHAPVCFQECIHKAYELRVTVIGREMFAVKLNSQHHPASKVDWRRGARSGLLAQEIVTVPAPLAAKIDALMKRLGLVFGALDIIVTPSGEAVFLEVNPSGQWLWCEYATGVPLLQSFVRLLIGGQRNDKLYRRVPSFELRTLERHVDDPMLEVRLPASLERLKASLGRWRYPTPEQFASALAKADATDERVAALRQPTADAVGHLLRLVADRAATVPSEALVAACLRQLMKGTPLHKTKRVSGDRRPRGLGLLSRDLTNSRREKKR